MTGVGGEFEVHNGAVRFRLAGGENPLILVPVHVNDLGPYEFVLDTGSSHCLLLPGLAETLGLRPCLEKQALGAGGSVKLAFANVASLSVGLARRCNVQVGITDELERIGAAIRTRVDGDLGFEFLKNFSLTIDYQRSELSFTSDAEAEHGVASTNSLPFKLAATGKPLILLQVIVNDKGPFQFVLDTGASRTILSSELAERLAIETTGDQPGTGGGGHIEIRTGKVRSVTVGKAIVYNLSVGMGMFLSMLSTAVGAPLDGILGYNFLNRFRVKIDYPRRTLELVPGPVR